MSVADKYMSEAHKKKFKFVPPEFNKNLFRNHQVKMGEEIKSKNNNEEELILYPTETSEAQLYCYYNEIGNCYKGNKNSRANAEEENERIKVDIPLPSEALRNFDLELNEEVEFGKSRFPNEVENIYSKIANANPNVLDTLIDYRIPTPVAKLITKRIVELALRYEVKE